MEVRELREAGILTELEEADAERLLALGRRRQCHGGQCLFLLGDHADRLYFVLGGSIDLTFPIALGDRVREVRVESNGPGAVLGWSALVKPHRFTLSARAAEDSELAAFRRQDLLQLFDAEPRIGYAVMRLIAEIVGRRLLQVQALWVRELQRAVTESLAGRPDEATRRPAGEGKA